MSDIKNHLKHCPFCGTYDNGDNRTWLRVASNSRGYFAVVCLCGATGPLVDSEESAIEAWNIRDESTPHPHWNPFRSSITSVPADFKGNLKSLRLSTILQILSAERKTGILQLIQGQTRRAICLKDGKIIAASGNQGLRLGQILYNKGLISPENLRNVLEEAGKSGKRVGEALLDLGYVTQDTLKDLIHHQIREAVLDLTLWGEGEFEYRDCQVEFDERGIEDINTMGIILEVATTIDEWANIKEI